MRVRIKGFAILLMGTIALMSLGLYACGGNSNPPSKPVEIQTVTVTRGNLAKMVSAFGRVSIPHQASLGFKISGNVAEVPVKFGDVVKQGDVLAKLETGSIERTVVGAKKDLRLAQINLDRAGSEARIAKAKAVVENAKSSLAAAELVLSQSQDATISDLAAAQAAVSTAQIKLDGAQRNLIIVQNNTDNSITNAQEQLTNTQETYNNYVQANIAILTRWDIAQQQASLSSNVQMAQNNLDNAKLQAESNIADAQNGVTQAQEALQNAQDNVETIKDNDAANIQQNQSQVATAQAALDEAKDDLAFIEAGLDVEQMQIAVDKALLAVDNSLDQLEGATIVAPFDGVIANVGVKTGDIITADTVGIKLVDTNMVEVDAAVDEYDVANMKPGQTANISIDALPNAQVTGKVTAVSPVAKVQSGVVTYDLVIEIDNPDRVDIKEGMTASADINGVLAANALLVPNTAIQKVGSTETVELVASSGAIQERVVQTGATDGESTEIVSGLAEGDQVVSGGAKPVASSTSSVLDMTFKQLTDNPRTNAVIQKYLGGLSQQAGVSGETTSQYENMPFSSIVDMLKQYNLVSADTIKDMIADLEALK